MSTDDKAQQMLKEIQRLILSHQGELPTMGQFEAMIRRTYDHIHGKSIAPTESHFEQFYFAFPIQKSKEKARREYFLAYGRVKRFLDDPPAEVLLRAAENYACDLELREEGGESITWPHTFLENDTWIRYGVKRNRKPVLRVYGDGTPVDGRIIEPANK